MGRIRRTLHSGQYRNHVSNALYVWSLHQRTAGGLAGLHPPPGVGLWASACCSEGRRVRGTVCASFQAKGLSRRCLRPWKIGQTLKPRAHEAGMFHV